MTRSVSSTTTLIAALSAVAFCFAGRAAAQHRPVEAAGFKAGFMCSGVFMAGRSPEQVLRDELGGSLPAVDALPDPVVDRTNRSVTVAYEEGPLPRLAVYVETLGTVLTPPGTTLDSFVSPLGVEMPMPQSDASKIPWPDGDRIPEGPLPQEVDLRKLSTAVESAFSHEKHQPSKTLGVVVVYKGRIIAERYATGWGRNTQYRSWSTAKSITNALVGILVRQGKLDLTDPAPIPEWQAPEDPRKAITIEHLLHMSSGLKSAGSMTTQAYWGGIDTGAEVTKNALDVEPGTRWKYSNYDTLILVRAIKEVIADDQAYLTFPRRELLNKIGMRHTFPEVDAFGNFILSSQVYTTPRDLARFGLLYLNDGVWNGERILPKGWVEYTARPAPAKKGTGQGYGAQFWLIGTDPRVPDDAYTTSGARGQLSTIIPSRDLVVARMGLDPLMRGKWDQAEFVSDLLDAIAETPSS